MGSRRIALLLAVAAGALPARGAGPEAACGGAAAACEPPGGEEPGAAWSTPGLPAPPGAPPGEPAALVVFWGLGCPRCEEARPVVARLAAERRARVEWVEVRGDRAGRARFAAEVERLGIRGAGIPLFVAGERAVVGFRGAESQAELRALLGGAPVAEVLDLPILGVLDPSRVPLGLFTAAVGLLDGFNPCAMYVLVVLLGILLHVPSRRRVALYGGAFVVTSGVVYFVFMTAWLGAFALGGVSRALTSALGLALVAMGLVDLKDVVWLKRGPSLSIPDRAKPGLFRRIRAVGTAASVPGALAGIVALAAVVNLVELGCTLGLPAMYTRVLSLRSDLGAAARLAYLALYNVLYVVPLAIVVAVFAVTLRRAVLSERGARVLKGVAGVLLVAFGSVFVLRPGLLG